MEAKAVAELTKQIILDYLRSVNKGEGRLLISGQSPLCQQ